MNETSIHPCNSMAFGQGGANASRESGQKENRRIDIRTTNSEETRRRIRRVTDLSMPKLMVCCLHDRDNDDNDNDDDGKSNNKAHLRSNRLSRRHGEQEKLHYLHIFPPSQVEKAHVSYTSGTRGSHSKLTTCSVKLFSSSILLCHKNSWDIPSGPDSHCV
jgi:hypothetical protein